MFTLALFVYGMLVFIIGCRAGWVYRNMQIKGNIPSTSNNTCVTKYPSLEEVYNGIKLDKINKYRVDAIAAEQAYHFIYNWIHRNT